MKLRAILMLLVAVAAGLGAVFFAAHWMQDQERDKGHVAVASEDIELGGLITTAMVRMTDWPTSTVPPEGSFKAVDPLEGRVTLIKVLRGEPLIEARLAPVGSKAGLSAVVRPGMRAITVRVNDVIGVAGFALPGTYVDVMVNTEDDNGRLGVLAERAYSISKVVLKRILVLAVAQDASRESTKPQVVTAVTLEVTPNDAQVLDLARSVGTLSLVLRNPAEPASAALTTGTTKAELLGWVKPVAEPVKVVAQPVIASAPVRHARAPVGAKAAVRVLSNDCVEIIRGAAKVNECF